MMADVKKPALFFLPGWGADASCFEPVVSHLADAFDTHCLGLPYSKASSFDDPDALVDAIADMIPSASYVVAWSLGGMLAVRLAARYPQKVAKLVTIGTNWSFVQRDDWVSAMPIDTFDRFYQGFIAQKDKTIKRFVSLQAQGVDDTKAFAKQLMAISVLAAVEEEHAATFLHYLRVMDNRPFVSDISCPLLMLFGANDALVPADANALISTSLINNIVIPDAGHAPHLSHTEFVADTLRLFFLDDTRYKKSKRRIAHAFGRAAQSYDQHAVLQKDVATHLCALAGHFHGQVLDLGCGTGFCLQEILTHQSVQHTIGLDLAADMLGQAQTKMRQNYPESNVCWLVADMEALPLMHGELDCVVSSLVIQWRENLEHLFREVRRVLKKKGRFVVSTLGPKTLHELRKAWNEADAAHIHVNRFDSAESVMHAAEQAHFDMDVYQVEQRVQNYTDVRSLMLALKGIGAQNVNEGSQAGLTTASAMRKLSEAYEGFRQEDGQLPATYEVLYWVFTAR